MIQTVVSRTKDLLGHEDSAEEPEEEDAPDPAEQVTTMIYSCEPCDQTYVTDEEMASCPRCDGPVEDVPNKYELGIT